MEKHESCPKKVIVLLFFHKKLRALIIGVRFLCRTVKKMRGGITWDGFGSLVEEETIMNQVRIEWATEDDAQLLMSLIRDLAAYEKLSHDVIATEADLRRALFSEPPAVEALIARVEDEAVGFALFFHNFSTFQGRRGLYLEDLFVKPESRGKGYGRQLLIKLARIAVERDCGRMEWSVLNWNELAKKSYRKVGAQPLDDWTVWRLTGEDLEMLAESD